MQQPKLHLIILSIFFTLLFSCTEKFYPEIDAEISILVVDGKITNKPEPYEVRLFRTVDLIKVDTLKPETGAIIVLNDDLGNSEILEEVRPGIYQTINQTIKGEVGQFYWINIVTQTGEKYESIPEKMPSPYNIENIYEKEEVKIISATEKQKVVNFYFNAKANSQDANFIRWEYRESYEWRSPEHLNTEKFTENPSKICYPVTDFPLINIYDASGLNSKIISKQATSTIYTNQVKLLYNYLIDVALFSTTQENYSFWENIKSVNYSEGDLYNVMTANITGNMIACDENCQIIGYFEVSSVSRLQKFFTANDFSLNFADYPEECETIEFRMYPPDPAKFHILTTKIVDGVGIYIARRKECYECNIAHPTSKPSFWP
jgi:hypothetical protein